MTTVGVSEVTTAVVVDDQVTVLLSDVGVQGPEGPAHEVFPFTMQDELEAVPGTSRVPIDGVAAIESVQAMVGTAPTGSAITVDVNKNGTSIFTTQGNRPTIADGQNTSGVVTTMNITGLVSGDYITVDVDAVGSGYAGKDLVVLVRLVKSNLIVLNAYINPGAIQGGAGF